MGAVSALIECISSRSLSVREAAKVAIAQVAEKGDQRSLDVLAGVFPDVLAIDSFSRIANTGSDCAIMTVVVCLEHINAEVREAAVQAVVRIAERGNKDACAALKARANHTQ